jgi:hypothetical protein
VRPLRREAAATAAGVDALIDEALLRSLEPTLAVLARLLESGRNVDADGGEPDGFDGIDRRGPIDRMLASDWALAGEEPEEFLRRYETRELGYLRLARRDDRRPQTSLVLFDTGPGQLGRPRVLHLACLVVLARRAAAAGAPLRWGPLNADWRVPASAPDTLARLVAARTFDPPPDLPPLDGLVDDALVVSGRQFGWPARQLVLREVGGDVEAVLYDNRSRRAHRALVPLPPAADAVRILRDPSGRARSASPQERHVEPETARPTSNLVFDQRGNKIFARTGDGRSVLVMPAPLSPHAQVGRVRVFRTAEDLPPVSAAGRLGRTVVLVTVLPGGTELQITTFGGDAGGLAGRYPIEAGVEPFLPRPDAPLGDVSHDVCLGLSATIDGFGLQQGWFDIRSFGVIHGFRTSYSHGAISAHQGDGGWEFEVGAVSWHLRLAPGEQLVGVTDVGGPKALVIDPDGTSVSRVGTDGRRTRLCAYGEPILDAAASGEQVIVAVRLESGAVALHHCATGQPLWTLGTPKPRPA